MSWFAAVPVAALDDERLGAMHIRVLTALCSYADKDGSCCVGQDRVAQRARTTISHVSKTISELCGWGWVERTRHGKQKANAYRIVMDRAPATEITPPEEGREPGLPAERLAETANHICREGKSQPPAEPLRLAEGANHFCPQGKSHLPRGQIHKNTVLNTVPNTVGECASAPAPNPAEQSKRKAAPRGAARGCRIPPNWAPSPQDYAVASKEGLDPQEISREADKFRDYFTAATGPNAAKRDWSATWRNWVRRAGDDKRRRGSRPAQQRGGSEQTLAAFDRFAERLAGDTSGQAAGTQSDAFTIDGEYCAAPARTGTGG